MNTFEWKGLWRIRTGLYAGRQLTPEELASLKTGSKIIFRDNKFYAPEGKQPRFVYCIAARDAAEAIENDVEPVQSKQEREVVSVEEAIAICRKMLITQSWGHYSLDQLIAECEKELKQG